ncbi:S8 family serine peptidase [Phaeobacter inhibens]|uniref:Thermophilic serine proteinase n=1 Tax=Phaeobacter inhibens TaxID=221822 RepID=A0A2I7KBT9_9RHOB|nr:S8 family serine peptidase [Phaeobacter inhibens]AUQ99980.1 Thermophilic serine proteinase precursor [Phaeobacter inhibens]
MKLAASSAWLYQGVLALWLAQPSAAQEFVEITVTGPLSPEARAAIADLIEPRRDHRALVEAFQMAVPAEAVLEPEELDDEGTPTWSRASGSVFESGSGGGGTNGDVYIDVPAMRVTDRDRIERLPDGLGAIPPNPFGQDFIFVERNSKISRAFGLPQTPTDAPEATVAVPIQTDGFFDLTPFGVIGANVSQRNVGFETAVVGELAGIEDDLEDVGTSVRVLQVPENLSTADRVRILTTLSAVEETTVNATNVSSSVRQEIPENAVIQTAVGGSCKPELNNWPFDSSVVAAVIRHNTDVLAAAGVGQFRRARILVIDSGLPGGLAQHEDFGRFLTAGPDQTLRRDYVWQKKNGGPTCIGRAARGQSRFGFFPMIQDAPTCVAREPLGALSPPPARQASPAYIPDHGGLVAVVAAGGPDLISEIPELHRMIGIRFARIMQTNGDRVVALPADISRAVKFAADDGFAVINASLRATERGVETFTPAFAAFRDKGLVIAAAGNSGGELLAGSQTFPAAIANAQGDNDGLIVVGGLHRPTPGIDVTEPWPQSSFSSRLVDIAAPSADILSLDGEANPACFSGTSVAAPQVSFAAAVLYSLGYATPAEIRRRILATARIDPSVATNVRDGRVLDLAVALDIYTDLIWLRGATRPERVRILPTRDDSDNPVIRLCGSGFSTLAAPDGWIDPARLHLWSRIGEDKARIWHDDSGGVTRTANECEIPAARIRVEFANSDQSEKIDLADIDRIVPTRLRESLVAAKACCNPAPDHSGP